MQLLTKLKKRFLLLQSVEV